MTAARGGAAGQEPGGPTPAPSPALPALPGRARYDDGQVAYHVGDCRDLLAALPAGSIDCVICDPPYGQSSLKWDVPVPGWPALCRRLLAPHGSIWAWGTLRSFLAAKDDFAGWTLAQDVVWHKHNGSSFHNDRFRRVHEQVAQFYPGRWDAVHKGDRHTRDAQKRQARRKGRPTHLGEIGDGFYVAHDGGPRLKRSVMDERSAHGRAIHPTQKPLGVLIALIEYSCPPGGLVLDPFAGSGSTLLAARLCGRRAIGIDISAYYAARAARWLSQGTLPVHEEAA